MPNTTNSITPYLHYADLEGAMQWLTKAFGFRELMRLSGPDNKPRHAEMALGETGVVMVGGRARAIAHRGSSGRSPTTCTRVWTTSMDYSSGRRRLGRQCSKSLRISLTGSVAAGWKTLKGIAGTLRSRCAEKPSIAGRLGCAPGRR
jgi:uncharacterized glyoxalase superfamily protein PhnB